MLNNAARVLIVDDEWTIRQQLNRALSSVGFRCECAVDGNDAFEKFDERHHDLVVTDLRMPAQNGHSLAVSLLEHPVRPKVVVLTGVTDTRIVNDLLARGIDDIVFKPVDYFEMAEGLRQMLSSPPDREQYIAASEIASHESEPAKLQLSPEAFAGIDVKTLERALSQSPPDNPWLIAAMKWIDWERLPKPTYDSYRFIQDLSSRSPSSQANQRSEPRATFRKLIVAVPLDSRLAPLDRPFRLRARDLSRHGIGLVHTEPLDAPNLSLSWKSSKRGIIVVLARILHCRQVMNYFDISAEILS